MNRALRMAVVGGAVVGLVVLVLPPVPDPATAETKEGEPFHAGSAIRNEAPSSVQDAPVTELNPLNIGLLRSRYALRDNRNPFRMSEPADSEPNRSAAEPVREPQDRQEALPLAVATPEPGATPATRTPFFVIGRVVEEGKTTVFLATGDRHYSVEVGDVIDGNYRVDSIEGLQVTLHYLPDSTEVVVAMAEP